MLLATLVLWAAGQVPDYHQLDLTPIANANPLSQDDMYVEGINVPATPYLWMEAETHGASSRPFDSEPAAEASGGLCLAGGFGAREGDWAEWYFDVPWETDDAVVYLRTARQGGNAFTAIHAVLNGEERGSVYVPPNSGWGDSPEDFVRGLCSISIGRVHAGRQVLRLKSGDTGDTVHLDGFWLAGGRLDIINRVRADGRIHDPASIHQLIYPYGLRRCGGIWFNLPDPAQTGGPAILLTESDGGEIPAPGVKADGVAFLGAGVRGPVTLDVEIVYGSGETSAHTLEFDRLYANQPRDPALAMGRYRHAFVRRIPLPDSPVTAVRLGSTTGRYLLLGVTLYTESDPY